MSPSVSAPVPPPPPNSLPAPTKPAWWKRTWVIATACGLLGIGIGVAGSSTDPKTTPEYKSLATQLDDATTNASGLQSQLDGAKNQLTTALGTIPAREKAVTAGEQQLKADQRALKAAQSSVLKRERAVGIVERTIARNTIGGDGIYQVGTDIKAGTYKTKGGSQCYYAVLNSSDTNDISDNNNITGPAIVTVHPGQYLELSGCNDFVWQQ